MGSIAGWGREIFRTRPYWSWVPPSLLYTGYRVYPGGKVAGGIATGCGLDGPGIDSRFGGEIFRTRPDWSWVPPSLLYSGYRVYPGGKVTGAWR